MLTHVSKFTDKNTVETIQKLAAKTPNIILITGYITTPGFRVLTDEIEIKKIKKIIVGVYNANAQIVFEKIAQEHPKIELFVFRYYQSDQPKRYEPMLHAKIIGGFNRNNLKWAYSGSANITSFALEDKNIESGFCISEPNKQLEHLNNTIKEILNSEFLINYKENRGLALAKEDTFILEPPKLFFNKINDARLIILNEKLKNKKTEIINIYCNTHPEFLEMKVESKILIYFLKDNKLILTKIRVSGNVYSVPEGDVSFYIQNLNGEGFKSRKNYKQQNNADTFLLAEKFDIKSLQKKELKVLSELLKKESEMSNNTFSVVGNSLLEKIVFKYTKAKFLNKDVDGLINNGLLDLKSVETIPAETITIQDIANNKEHNIFNTVFKMNRIL
jgi:hypothetical protein